MPETFSQQQFFVKKSFTFKEDGIDFYSKENGEEFSKFIHFNDIEPRTKCRIYTEANPKILQGGAVICLVALVRVFLTGNQDLKTTVILSGIVMLLGLLTVAAYFVLRIKYFLIELENETQLFVIINKPNQQAMEAFVDEVFERRKKYYRDNYFYINYESTKEKELSRMNWLKNEKLITENEYNVVVDEINENLA